MRRITLIVNIASLLCLVVVSIVYFDDTEHKGILYRLLGWVVPYLLLAGIGWKWPLIGGIILILIGIYFLGMGIFSFVYTDQVLRLLTEVYLPLVLSYLISGVCFLLLRRYVYKATTPR